MKTPKSITPDRIRDAIIEINFESDYPHELNLGVFFNVLKDNYKYSNKPIGSKQLSTNNGLNFEKEITLSLGGVSLFYNDRIKFQINNNSIAFNCLSEYILWENYSQEIRNVLKLIISLDIIKSFNRVGLRYISEYQNTDLKDNINFNFSFGFPEIVSNRYSFTTEFDFKNFKVVLNLDNKLPIVKDNNLTPTSLVDIDVIKLGLNIRDFDDLYLTIEEAHTIEKQIFFKLLKEEFLKELNPKY